MDTRIQAKDRKVSPETLVSSAVLLDADLEAQKHLEKQKKKGWFATLFLAYNSIGVIYGDIGTSPLYVYSSTFPDTPTKEQVYGATSIIFWTVTIVVVVKYLLIVLLADDEGEGGTFAIYSLLCRCVGIMPGTTEHFTSQDRSLTSFGNGALALPSNTEEDNGRTARKGGWRKWVYGSELTGRASRGLRRTLGEKMWANQALLILVLVMSSMVLGDGVLTPAQSVLGAIYGIQVKSPSTSTSTIVGISCAIIVILFLFQRFGTTKIGFVFAPIVLVWFFCNVITAIHNIHAYDHTVFKCLSPYWAIKYFIDGKRPAWESLSGIFLAITGGEAVFADLGHFSRASIQLSFLCVAYPSLILTYLGQAAFLVHYPDQVGSTFYASIPWGDGFFWFFFIVSTLAAIVASQAMITGAFSIIRQSMALGCFPRLTVKHTSRKVEGQVYIPEASFVMMVLTVIVVVIFKNTVQLGNAYGVAISMMMLGTTLLIFIVMIAIWRTNLVLAILFLVVYVFIESIYVSANLHKVPKGGWYTILIAAVVATASYIWTWGTVQWRKALFKGKTGVQDLLSVVYPGEPSAYAYLDPTDTVQSQAEVRIIEDIAQAFEGAGPASPSRLTREGVLADAHTGEPLLRNPGMALLYSEHVLGRPPVLGPLVKYFKSLHQITVFVVVRQIPIKAVREDERLLVAKLPFPGIYACIARYGYSEEVDHGEEFVSEVFRKVGALDPDILDNVPRNKVYVLSRPMVTASHSGFVRRIMLDTVYGTMVRFSRQAWEEWKIPFTYLVEVGVGFAD